MFELLMNLRIFDYLQVKVGLQVSTHSANINY